MRNATPLVRISNMVLSKGSNGKFLRGVKIEHSLAPLLQFIGQKENGKNRSLITERRVEFSFTNGCFCIEYA